MAKPTVEEIQRDFLKGFRGAEKVRGSVCVRVDQLELVCAEMDRLDSLAVKLKAKCDKSSAGGAAYVDLSQDERQRLVEHFEDLIEESIGNEVTDDDAADNDANDESFNI